jgi:hypothetical protein
VTLIPVSTSNSICKEGSKVLPLQFNSLSKSNRKVPSPVPASFSFFSQNSPFVKEELDKPKRFYSAYMSDSEYRNRSILAYIILKSKHNKNSQKQDF